MQLIKERKTYRCDSEAESDAVINKFKAESDVIKTTATLKTKKSKGEVVDSWVETEIVINYEVEA